MLIFPTGRQYFYFTVVIKNLGSLLGLCSPLGDGEITKRERDRRKEQERWGRKERRNYFDCELFIFLCMIPGVGLVLRLQQ